MIRWTFRKTLASHMTILIFVGGCVLLSGCVPFPRHTTLQPKTHFMVRDNFQQPLVGATITLITYTYPHRREEFRTTKLTDASGSANFEVLQEWQTIYPLMIHGISIYSWTWHGEKEGYVTISHKLTTNEVEVTMQALTSKAPDVTS